MTEAATALLDGLSPTERTRAVIPFADEDERRGWHYIPRDRNGVRLADMADAQHLATHVLLATLLSRHAHAQVASIVALEDVLNLREGGHQRRHSGNYWVTVFGRPGADRWGWRFEGHHVSVNATIVDGRVAHTPLFLGANPARSAVAPLAAEEDEGRAFALALPGAVVDSRAPDDIVTAAAPLLEPEGYLEPAGVAAPESVPLAARYAGRVTGGSSPPPDDLRFAWLGSLEEGKPHYYRLQAPRFLVEYDNRQDGANHIHTVVRDPAGDFGADLLARHYEEHH